MATTKKTTTAKTRKPRAKAASATKNVVALKQEPADIAAQLEIVREDVATLAKSVKAQSKARFASTKESVKQSATDGAQKVQDSYQEYADLAETKIRSNPLTSVAIAAGVGALIGLIARR